MFESANLRHHVPKPAYKREVSALREALLEAQFELAAQRRFAVLILIAGVEGAGKGETVNLLNEWMDPRRIHTRAFFQPTDEERGRPDHWRFWRALPPKGDIGIFFGAWHTVPMVRRALGEIDDAAFGQAIGDIRRLETMLCDEGVLLLKYWLHLSKKQQKQRLRELEKNPATRWRVTEHEWEFHRRYDDFVTVSEPFLRETSTGPAPWIVVPGADPRFRAPGFPQQNPGYAPNGYPQQNPGYPQQNPGYPQQNPGYAPNGYPQQNPGYAPNGYPQQNPGYAPNGYPQQNPGYAPNSNDQFRPNSATGGPQNNGQ